MYMYNACVWKEYISISLYLLSDHWIDEVIVRTEDDFGILLETTDSEVGTGLRQLV